MKKIDISRENRDLMYHKDKSMWFEKINDNEYTIKSDLDYLLKYSCINYDSVTENDEYDFKSTDQFGITHYGKIISFDPSGGPYIAVENYCIEGKPVKRIYNKDKQYIFVV